MRAGSRASGRSATRAARRAPTAGRQYAKDYEVILFGVRSLGRELRGKRTGAVLEHPRVRSGARHVPFEKPVGLLTPLVERHSPLDGTVLDPFAGSGYTLVAARAAGRRSIGIEIEERYCEVAANRLRQDVLGLSA